MGNTKSSIKVLARSGIGLISTLLGVLLQFIASVLLARVLGPEDFGVYVLAFSISLAVAQLSTGGLLHGAPKLMAPSVGELAAKNAFGAAMTALVCVAISSSTMALLLFILAGTTASLFELPELGPVLSVFSLLLFSHAMLLMLSNVFRGFSNVWPNAVFVQTGTRLIRLLGLSLLFYFGFSLTAVSWVVATSSVAVLLVFVAYTFVSSDMLQSRQKGWSFCWLPLLAFSLPLGANVLVEVLNLYSSRILLGFFSSAEEVGYFGATIPLCALLTMPLNALGFAYLPEASRLIKSKKLSEVEILFKNCTRWVSLLSVGLFLAIQLEAELIVGMLFGVEYREVGDILRVLSLGYFIRSLCGPNAMTLIANGNAKPVLVSNLIGATVNILFCWFLISNHGAMGAAFSMALGIVFGAFLNSWMLKKMLQIHPFESALLKCLLFVFAVFFGVMLIDFFVFYSSPITGVVNIVVIAIATLISPVVTRTLTGHELEFLEGAESRFLGGHSISQYVRRRCSR